MNRVWKNLKGYDIISVCGFGKERFVNLCKNNSLPVWDLKFDGNELVCGIYHGNRAKVFDMAEKTGCRCRVMKVCGLPVFLNMCKRHFVFISGYFAFIVFVKIITLFIWNIDIVGNSATSDSDILALCNENGLYEGACTLNLDYKNIAKILRDNFENISWANVTSKGTRLVVRVAQSGETSGIEQEGLPSDIVADRDCVITEIIAVRGMPQVKAGDSVQKNDVLVSGKLVPVGFEENREVSYTDCEAKIRGKCVENKSITIPLQYIEKVYTDKKYKMTTLVFFNKKFNTNFIKSKPKYKKYDIIKEVKQLGLDENHPLPAFVSKDVYREYTQVKRTLTTEEAKNKAAAQLVDYIVESYPLSSDILSTKLEYDIKSDSVVLNAVILSECDIGKNQPLTPQEEQDVNGTAENTDSQ